MALIKRLILLSSAIFLAACGTSMDRIPNSSRVYAKMVEFPIETEDFDQIVLDITAKIDIRQGDTTEVKFFTEPEHIAYLETFVEDGVLNIVHGDRHHQKMHTAIEIVLPKLTGLEIDAVVEANLTEIRTGDIVIRFDGVGEVNMDGSCKRAEFYVDGIGDFDAGSFKCRDVKARFSGIGDITVYAFDSVDIDVSGIGSASVLGHPKHIEKDASGIGSVDIRH